MLVHKVDTISDEEFKEEMGKPRRQVGQWAKIIAKIQKTGKPVRITGLTRGQVASIARSVKEAGLQYRTDYKNGVIVLGR